MAESMQIGACPSAPGARKMALWLQGFTIAWMVAEFGVAAYAAATAHSPTLLAFSSDSLVELISASVVILQWFPLTRISESRAARATSVLLFALTFVVAGTAAASLALRLRPEVSVAGIGITIAALIVMPLLAAMKHREARTSGNRALAADAVQSAACAYLALISLMGLSLNAVFHLAWFDSIAALVAVPILFKEARSAWLGEMCGCC